MSSVMTSNGTLDTSSVSKTLNAGTTGDTQAQPLDVRNLSDDEILNLGSRSRTKKRDWGHDEPRQNSIEGADFEPQENRWELQARDEESRDDPWREESAEDKDVNHLRQEAEAYRSAFGTPDEALSAKARISELETIDSLFYSDRSEDHAKLAKMLVQLSPGSFTSLAKAMNEMAHREVTQGDGSEAPRSSESPNIEKRPVKPAQRPQEAPGSHHEFVATANAAAVRTVLGSIESSVDRILPEGASPSARNRLIGEVYREVDAALQNNTEFGQQIRSALRSGNFNKLHHDAVVSLIASRAKQILPAALKRVLSEWTSTTVASQQDRSARQRRNEARVDIDGTRGGLRENRKIQSPRDIDYRRMSDADILNL